MTKDYIVDRPPENAGGRLCMKICEEMLASPEHLETLDVQELRRSFRELCLHQVELQARNERLRLAVENQEPTWARYFMLYDMAPVGYCTLDQAGIILDVNTSAALLFAQRKEQMVGQPFSSYVLVDDRDRLQRHLQAVSCGTGSRICELRMSRDDGMVFWGQITAAMLHTGQNHEISVVIADMTERKLSEKALRQRERGEREAKNLLKLVLDTIPIRIFWKDTQSTYLGCNMLFARDAGFETPEELIGLNDFSMRQRTHTETYRRDDLEIINSGVPKLAREEIITAPDGRQWWVSSSKVALRDDKGRIIGILGFYEDITRQKQLVSELPKAEKLESLALFAGGIANELNNIMMTIMGGVSMIKLHLTPSHAAFDRLGMIESSVLKTKELIQGFLAFATNSLPYRNTFSAANLIDTYCRLTLGGRYAPYTCELAVDLWSIEADVGQVGQALASVLAYASEGLSENDVIRITCENTVVYHYDPLPLNSGGYVRMVLKSTGKVIPEAHVATLFNPTLTRQERGGALGLAGAYAQLVENDGFLSVASTPEEGTEFTIYLPASPAPARSADAFEEVATNSGGKILVMDDDPLICNILESMLQQLGYTSDSALEGNSALAKYIHAKQSGAPFDAVIMDLIISGGMGGRETMKKLMLIDPLAKVIVSSGYINNLIMREYRRYGFSDVMEKPYRFSQLQTTLQRALASGHNRPV